MAKIMIVDNVAFERVTLKDIVGQVGHEVVAEINNGFDLLKAYKQTKPDFVIMDITFPDDDGMEVLKELFENFPDAKVCICTAMAQQAIIIQAVQLGVKDFIVKPYNAERIKESLKKYLG
ncbi:MAG: response regulator [Candidatus Gastranaerophilales bacterium]|nr:response regulator [Candidatus Gastranaerophilales bacterium]